VILARPETNIEMERFTPVYMDYYRGNKPDVFRMIKDVETVPADSLVTGDILIDLGGIIAEVIFAGPAHTAGDLVVNVPSKRIVFAGGLVSNMYHTNLGDQGGDFDNWLAALDRLETMDPKIVVPGQGPAGGSEMIAAQRGYIVDIIGLTVDAIRRGRPLSQSILEIKIPGTEGFEQENLVPFNIQAVYRKNALEAVSPGVALDMPTGFIVSDAAGGPDAGMIQWIVQSEEGYIEFEMSWQPTSRGEIIVEDIHDRISRYAGSVDGLYDFEITGQRKILAGGEAVPAAFGTWSYRKGTNTRGGGIWSWTMILVDGKVYSIRMLTNTGNDLARGEENIAMMEQVVSTLRKK
jgi:hypothetical protein